MLSNLLQSGGIRFALCVCPRMTSVEMASNMKGSAMSEQSSDNQVPDIKTNR